MNINKIYFKEEEIKNIILKANNIHEKNTLLFNDFIKDIWCDNFLDWICTTFANAFVSHFDSEIYQIVFKIEQEEDNVIFEVGFKSYNGKVEGFTELEEILMSNLISRLNTMDFSGYLKLISIELCGEFENSFNGYSDYIKQKKEKPTKEGLQTFAKASVFGENALIIFQEGE